MKHTLKNENGHLIAKVSFDKEEIAAAREKATKKLALNVVVPGFRKGKAPVEKAASYLRSQDVANETINALLRNLDKNMEKDEEFSSYIHEQKFFTGLQPDVSLDKFDNDEAQFTVTYFLKADISKLGQYKDLQSTVKEKVITDEDVENEIQRLAKDNAELVPAEKEAEMGDTVNIDFTGLMDGKPFDGGSATSFDLELGSKHFVPGFEEQCVSHKAGDKFDVALTMPENYPAPLTNKPVVFKVTMNAVKTKEVPEINDEFATTLSGQYVAKDLAELKLKVKDILGKNAFDAFKRDTVNDLLLQVRNNSEFVISSELLNVYLKDKEAEDEENLNQQGLTLDEYLKLVNQTKEEYEANNKAGLEEQLKSSLVFQAIAKAEGIKNPGKEEVEKQLGTSIDEFVKNFTNYLKAQKMPQEQIDHQINNYISQVISSMMSASVQAKILEINSPELAKRTFTPAYKPEVKEETKAEAEEAKEEKPAEEAKAE